ncbi:MAG: sterol desaturase family protein [Proteobacteria bacterium]|nr:sterol desaturase family protein [Pseudomonadota bacterium]
MEQVLSDEVLIRLAVFAGILAAMMLLEWLWPKRPRTLSRGSRWPGNLGVVVVDTIAVRLLVPLPPAAAALWASEHGIGLFNMLAVPPLPALVASVLLLDLAIYAQHVMFHKLPMLWRIHRMHHADTEFDASTGLRFHPIEIVLSVFIKIVLVVVLGAPALAVIIFEIVLNGTAMFNHANLALPTGADRILRLVVVTPDMHRVHHSWHRDEIDSNYGFNWPWWDRLFGTYKDQPTDGHAGMTIGLPHFREAKYRDLMGLLKIPFQSTEN